jgi:hypothetical protein
MAMPMTQKELLYMASKAQKTAASSARLAREYREYGSDWTPTVAVYFQRESAELYAVARKHAGIE